MIKILLIASGGSVGSVFRYFFSYFLKNYFNSFPLGTLCVNVLGSFLIGLTISYLNFKDGSEIFIKYFFIIGFLGSFTTFSAFSIDTIDLINEKKILLSMIYIMLSIFLSILAAYIGIILLK